jgi:hypothetical protein
MEYLGWWLVMDSGRLRVKFRSRQKAVRVRDYLAGDMPADDSPVWSRVAAGVCRDLGIEAEGKGNE